MLFLSDRMTSASGSIGGTTFSHNRFGMYTRARRSPVNPNTSEQQDARAAFASASAGWRALTEAQRDAWNAYAANTPTVNALGQSVYLTGAQHYTACNAFSTRIGNPTGPFSAAPVTAGKVELGDVTVTIDVSSANITVGNIAAGVDCAAIFLGNPISAGVSFFKGPYQFRASDLPAGGTFSAAGLTGRNGMALTLGMLIPWRVAGQDSTGRLSTVKEGVTTVVA